MVDWLAVLLGLLPALIWMAFFLQEDRRKPEPKGLIISTFLWGGLITFVTLQVQIVLQDVLVMIGVVPYTTFSIFWMAGVEEVLKFSVVLLWVRRRRSFDEPIDAMIYMIVAALGFATVENIASLSTSINGFELITLRFMGATLLHALSSALLGFYWAISMVRGRDGFFTLATGWFLATLLHGIFNWLTLLYGPTLFVTLFLVFAGFFILNDFEKLKKPAIANVNISEEPSSH